MAVENEKQNTSENWQSDKYTIKEMANPEREDVTRISDETLLAYAGQALSEVEGVVKSHTGIVGGFLGKKGPGRAIKIESSDQEVVVEVTLELKYGVKIPDVASMIQRKIRRTIEEYTGKFVRSVNVNIEGIQLPMAEKMTPKGAAELKKEFETKNVEES